jgi:YYY domain-containing protein
MNVETEQKVHKKRKIDWKSIVVVVSLVTILLVGWSFRSMNNNWDESKHLHPDERYLSMVINAIEPVWTAREYFDTATSPLNPGNKDFGFFVYGTLPVFIVRYAGEWTGQVGYDLNTLLGRTISAVMDTITILLTFFIAKKLFNRWVGLIAAALYAFAVLPIQLAHFMTVDSFTNTFGMLTMLMAVVILKRPLLPTSVSMGKAKRVWYALWPYLAFGAALGMATASKINAIALALLLPMAEGVRYFRLENEGKEQAFMPMIGRIGMAAVMSFVVFRICQPYAFDGPGFFNFSINQNWWQSMRSLQAQSTGEVDFPPALQWARRPLLFSFKNLVLWGIGLPFGFAAIGSIAAMGVNVIRKKHWDNLPLLAWTLFYAAWQGLAWVKSMRYLMLIYPLLAIIAAWGLWLLIAASHDFRWKKIRISSKSLRIIGVVSAALVLSGTLAYAFAFSRIYTRPVTRIEASEWIYENIAGPINLILETDDGNFMQQGQYRNQVTLLPGQSYISAFVADRDGMVESITFPQVQDLMLSVDPILYTLDIREAVSGDSMLPEMLTSQPAGGDQLSSLDFYLDQSVSLEKGKTYNLVLGFLTENCEPYLTGVPVVTYARESSSLNKQYLPRISQQVTMGNSFNIRIMVTKPGEISQVVIPQLVDASQNPGSKTLRVTLTTTAEDLQQTVSAVTSGSFLDVGRGLGSEVVFDLPQNLVLSQIQEVDLTLELVSGSGQIAVNTVGVVHETDWDDGLPLMMNGYIPYDPIMGIFRNDLNLDMYAQDDQAKRDRFFQMLSQGEYIFMSSNRQWGTIPRVPERYPLSTAYYRALVGCPEEMDSVTCYNLAEPGKFEGQLGFELVETFTSYPNLGDWEFNDQFAEEAFSVYDHPKVMIFRKTDDFDPEKLAAFLDSVDISQVIYLTPRQASQFKSGKPTLMLSEEDLQLQQQNGTWSDIFDRNGLLNRNPVLAVLAFYGLSLLLGLLVFPLLRLGLPGLKDKGYGFSKIIGFLLFAYIAFVLGSAGVAVTRGLLLGVLGLIALAGVVTGFLTRHALVKDLKRIWKQLLVEEVVTIVMFAFFLLIRWLNPDLWHPWRGGEKPMDFSYLNAVIKSTVFPAYDPWYAGGYINYYYYGQVVIGLPMKLLGVIPATAYNILLALWYGMLSVGVFSLAWNITKSIFGRDHHESNGKVFDLAFWAGISAMLVVGFLGNLGEVKLFSDAISTLGSGGQAIADGTFVQRVQWLLGGIGKLFRGEILPISAGSWYWNPSRTIPGEAITEFPFFTFLYADFHAHLIAMPVVVAAMGWGLSVLMSRGQWHEKPKRNVTGVILGFLFGGLVIGALKPINTWDFYTFLILNLTILAYVGWRYVPAVRNRWLSPKLTKIVQIGLGIVALYLIASLLYQPFNRWFYPGYGQVGIWDGDRTPLASYFTHWGLLIFLIVFWFGWESYQWMSTTKVASLKRWAGAKSWIVAGLVLIGVCLVGLLLMKVQIAIVALPMCLWALALLIAPGQPDGKKLLYFMTGTGFLLTIVVELVHLVGDIGRMNVVFKLYLQAWMFLALVAGIGLAITWRDQSQWRGKHQVLFQVPLILLLTSALMFPIFATRDKVTDRMNPEAPHTLDGMKYMETSRYQVNGVDMDLGQDYRAIQWMQDNVEGSPVILEAQAYEYYWGNRYTIYTGLPGVVGWNYHQRQQRAVTGSDKVQARVDEVNAFFTSLDEDFITSFLEKYRVQYIIVGQQERAFYPQEALMKFPAYNGVLWDEVYHEGSTVIYQVR